MISYKEACGRIPEEVDTILVGSGSHEGLDFVVTHRIVLEQLQGEFFEGLVQLLPLIIGIIGNWLLQQRRRELLARVGVGVHFGRGKLENRINWSENSLDRQF